MRKMIEMFGEAIRELRKDLDIYMTIQKYARATRKERRGAAMKNSIMTILVMVFFGLLSVHTASAYILDGDLGDWGVTPFTKLTPSSSTASYTIERGVTHYGKPMTGYILNVYDREAMYFDYDANNIYFAMITATIDNGPRDRSIDLKIDVTSGGSQRDYGLDIGGSSTVLGVVQDKKLVSNPKWTITYSFPTVMTDGTGTTKGTGKIFYKNLGKIDPDHDTTYIVEGSISRSLLDIDPLSSSTVALQWGYTIDDSGEPLSKRYFLGDSLNDWIQLNGSIPLNGPVPPPTPPVPPIPEPATMSLLGMGLMGFIIRKRLLGKK